MAKTEVAEVKKTAVALPEGYDMDELIADAQQNPTMDASDVALPFIALLQSNSPEVNPGHSAYIEGSQSSMFMNTMTGDVYEGRKEGLLIVPCHYERKLVEWVDRDTGGGWVADYPTDHPIKNNVRKNEKGKDVLPNGNFLVETAYQYILVMDPSSGSWSQAVLGLKSTALKKNRQLNNSIVTSKIPGTEVQAPRYMYPYTMRSVFEQKGENSWWNYEFKRVDEPVLPEVYRAAKAFAQMVASGLLSRSTTAEGQANVATDGQGQRYDKTTGEVLDDEIPL